MTNMTIEKQKLNNDSKIKSIVSNNKFMFAWLLAFALSNVFSGKVNEAFDETKFKTAQVLNANFLTDFPESKKEIINKLVLENIKIHWDNIHSSEFQLWLYNLIKSERGITWMQLIQAFILGLLYGYAYLKTVKKVKNWMPIDQSSFLTFSLTSWWMILVNGFVPWSIVYLESFLLAWYVVYLDFRNQNKNNNN